MFDLGPGALGIIFLLMGLGFLSLVALLLRLTPKIRPLPHPQPSPLPSDKAEFTGIAGHNEAVLVVQHGGRVAYINDAARELFNVWEDEPNLESLARRTRPAEVFLGLCASEGQARFTLNGRFVEATSYFAALTDDSNAPRRTILVTLRRPQVFLDREQHLAPVEGQEAQGISPELSPSAALSPSIAVSAQAINTITELSQAMTASLDLPKTLQTVLESVERLLPSDFLEITLWDAENRWLVPYRLVGIAGVDRRLEQSTDRYAETQGYSGYLLQTRQGLLVKDINTFRLVRPALDRQRYPFQSYLGVPLVIAGELIGTLELASLQKNNYTENDLEVLKLLSGQAAVAVNNALLYQQEQQRVTELAGLARLAQTVSSIRDPQDLYTQLVEQIAPLLDVEILGFLIFDENRRLLQAQKPFRGIQAGVVDWYQIPLPPGSAAEAIWQSGEPIIASNAPEDPRLIAMGLHHVALAAGIRYTILAPLSSGGRLLGYLQVGDKRDGTPFDKDDLRFVAIIAGQAAPIIDNANLVQQSRKRTQRAETLRRIASLISSAATIDEVLKFSLMDLARLLQADVAAVLLLDENRGELVLHRPSSYGLSPETAVGLGNIAMDAPAYQLTATATRQHLFTADLAEDPDFPDYYRPLAQQPGLHSFLTVPLISRQRALGELLLGSLKPNFFSQSDVQGVATAASQLAAAYEQSTLLAQTDESLRARVEALMHLNRLNREFSTRHNLDLLLQEIYEEALRLSGADCGLVWYLKPTEQNALLSPPLAGGNGQKTAAESAGWETHPLLEFPTQVVGETDQALLSPLEIKALQSGELIYLEDIEAQPAPQIAEAPSYQPPHHQIRSALLAPIAYQGRLYGLIHLHGRHRDQFGELQRQTCQALAVQAAIALENLTRLVQQEQLSRTLNQRVEALSRLVAVSRSLQTAEHLDNALQSLAQVAQSATPFEQVMISMLEPESGALIPIASAGQLSPKLTDFHSRWPTWADLAQQLPALEAPEPIILLHGDHWVPLKEASATGNGHLAWQESDLLLLPVYTVEQQPLGLIQFDAPRDGLRPDAAWSETLTALAEQAALIIANYRRLEGLNRQVVATQSELQVALESAQLAQSHLPTLLHKDLEQTLAIAQLSQRLQRLTAGLEIAAVVNQKASRQAIYQALAQELFQRMEFDTVLVAEHGQGVLNITDTAGRLPTGVNPQALLGQRNPLRHSLQTGEILLVADLQEQPEWQQTPLLNALEARSFICLPIASSVVGDASAARPDRDLLSRAAVLAVSQSPLAPFTEEDQKLFGLLLEQVTIALQNQDLIDETIHRLSEINLLMEFSRRLSSLDLASVLNSLLDSAMSAVPAAQMGMVALWDPRQQLLIPQIASGYADPAELLQIKYRPGEGLPGQIFEQRQAQRLDVVDFARHYNLSPDNLLHYRNATAGRLPVSSVVIPIVSGLGEQAASPEIDETSAATPGRGRVLGILELDSAQLTSAFTEDDVSLLTLLAQQTALTLENTRLFQAAEQRSQQLQALTRATSAITSSLQSEDLIPTLLDQLRTILPYDTGILWLREKGTAARPGQASADRLVIRSVRGFEDGDQRLGLSVNVEDSALLLEMIRTGQPIWVPDVSQDPRFQTMAMEAFERLSWLGIPLIASNEVIGVIALEKTEPAFYSADDIQVATTFAGQAAVSMQNARLFQESLKNLMELDQRTQTLTILNRLTAELSHSLDIDQILRPALQEFAEIINCTAVSALLFDYESSLNWSMNEIVSIEQIAGVLMLRAEYPGNFSEADSGYALGAEIPPIPLLERLRDTLGIFSTEDIEKEPELDPWKPFLARQSTRALLIVPIVSGSTSSNPLLPERFFHGVLLAHHEDNYRFQAEELELARTISNQLAISLQNARLYEETRRLTTDLEVRVLERTAELGREHRRSETLLRIITELAASLDLDQVLHSTLQVLNEFVDAEQIFILISRPGEQNLVRLASLAYSPETAEAQQNVSFDVSRGLAGWVISKREPFLTANLHEDERWQIIPHFPSELELLQEFRSVMGMPLMSGAEALGCLILLHSEPGHFSPAQLDLVQAAANQVAVAVNNAELYRLIRDQAEDLGTMLRNQQIETSRTKAMLEAVADGVLVTDPDRTITLFNESAERILGLSREQVLGQSMEHFMGLFGRAASRWLETIATWSQDPSSYQPGDVYSERIVLEDGRVIQVQLAPVILRSDFLGTVSTFQDITHQVEVDRLKSEFVATVSHELRTPMTSIKGYVDILLMGAAGALSEQQTHFLQIVKSNTERLAVLVNDLLDISQIEAGRVKLSLQPLNIEEQVHTALKELQRRLSEADKQVTIREQIEANLPPVLADAERLQTILSNLLDNAYQYNTPGGEILVRVQRLDSEIQIDVKDSGVGIHPNDQPRVFERFFRGENPLVLGVAGTGLGLSIVKNLVEMHHGRIWLESKGIPGEGSTFSFTLPIYRSEADQKENE